jgi:hypothetical protein
MSKWRACPGRGHCQAIHVPRLELVSFDPHGRSLCLGPNHPARGDELQRTYAIQHRRPVHSGSLSSVVNRIPPLPMFSVLPTPLTLTVLD